MADLILKAGLYQKLISSFLFASIFVLCIFIALDPSIDAPMIAFWIFVFLGAPLLILVISVFKWKLIVNEQGFTFNMLTKTKSYNFFDYVSVGQYTTRYTNGAPTAIQTVQLHKKDGSIDQIGINKLSYKDANAFITLMKQVLQVQAAVAKASREDTEMEIMKFCQKCGNQASENMKFCQKCGAPFS